MMSTAPNIQRLCLRAAIRQSAQNSRLYTFYLPDKNLTHLPTEFNIVIFHLDIPCSHIYQDEAFCSPAAAAAVTGSQLWATL
ncbi:hypothetical protein AMEX_G723 [Astyanax mexicanus]|uniref:Uncharacterized protein n=1 Tax=Astyanax mexicanus TaxID=7994 RepID=A0A8T2MCG0_ASTMX|nr:hypothetical protein AMEX_G723 [Astyanax mexicanus]